jgi:hypothetical protein
MTLLINNLDINEAKKMLIDYLNSHTHNSPYLVVDLDTHELPWGWIFRVSTEKNMKAEVDFTGLPYYMVDKFTSHIEPISNLWASDFKTSTLLKKYAADKNYIWQDDFYIDPQIALSDDWAGSILHEKTILPQPLEYQEAFFLASNLLSSRCTLENPVHIIESWTVNFPWGWLFFYATSLLPADVDGVKPWDYNCPLMIDKNDSFCIIWNLLATPKRIIQDYILEKGYKYDFNNWTSEMEKHCQDILEM